MVTPAPVGPGNGASPISTLGNAAATGTPYRARPRSRTSSPRRHWPQRANGSARRVATRVEHQSLFVHRHDPLQRVGERPSNRASPPSAVQHDPLSLLRCLTRLRDELLRGTRLGSRARNPCRMAPLAFPVATILREASRISFRVVGGFSGSSPAARERLSCCSRGSDSTTGTASSAARWRTSTGR